MKQKGFAPILLILVIALGALGYFGYKNFKQKSKPFPYQTPIQEQNNNLKGWKLYESKKFGFSVNYPEDARLTSRDPDPFPVVVQIDNLKPRTGGGGGPEVEGWFLTVSEIQENNGDLSLNEWAKVNHLREYKDPNLPVEAKETPAKDIFIGGLPAISWTSEGGDARLIYYLIKRSNGIQLIMANSSPEDGKTIDQILSTFRFL